MQKILITAFLALFLGACVTQHFEAPQVSIAGAKIVSIDVWQQRIRVRVHVHNPNSLPLPVRRIEYNLEVAGQQFASGSSDDSFTVPANGDAEFDTTITTNVAGAAINLIARSGGLGDSVDYHLTGKVSIQGYWRTLPFDQRGTVKLKQ